MRTDLATRSIDAMVARVDEALAEPREPFAWMPVLREHASADVPGPMAYDGEALSPVGEIATYAPRQLGPLASFAMDRGGGISAVFFDEVQWINDWHWSVLARANVRAPYLTIGGSNA